MTEERARRWRLLLGSDPEDGDGTGLSGQDQALDRALGALYDRTQASDGSTRRSGGLGSSAPRITKWLGDIRGLFPNTVVQVLQRDAMERLDLATLLRDPELIESIEPDIHLASTLAQLGSVLPGQARAAARRVVQRVVEDLERRLAEPTRAAALGAIRRGTRTRRPRPADIDWNRTIAANLKHYLPEHRTVVPHRLIGHGRQTVGVQREVVIALDQSGSMAESVVYASIFAAVLSTVRSLQTSLVAFDTSVVDLTDRLSDPVEVIFGAQLGGGTDINQAIAYCAELITRPTETLLVLISDLFEGGNATDLVRRLRQLRESGVTAVCLLALDDSGSPAYDHDLAGILAQLGIPSFACTPDVFPELLEAALSGAEVDQWVSRHLAERATRPGADQT
ncbi:hypothetical protein CGZ93_04870 [Enemella dayhoffiae]|uniref:VWFA domain-containing protein n=1 Tax=Enemella dayhoffiae TaxID=2016507 RepID=A0A255HAT7_9ACTN|nr:VWA domain-containing protein [Enemella dayhoffiae]OYO24153.1 hypothetical protein CGZ93_04870 [Enemella dayhoffiae]